MGETCTKGWVLDAEATKVRVVGSGPTLIVDQTLLVDRATRAIEVSAAQLVSYEDNGQWLKVKHLTSPRTLQPFGETASKDAYDVTYVAGHPIEISVAMTIEQGGGQVTKVRDGQYVGPQLPACERGGGCAIQWGSTPASVRFDRVGDAPAEISGDYPFGQQGDTVGKVTLLEVTVAHGAIMCGDDRATDLAGATIKLDGVVHIDPLVVRGGKFHVKADVLAPWHIERSRSQWRMPLAIGTVMLLLVAVALVWWRRRRRAPSDQGPAATAWLDTLPLDFTRAETGRALATLLKGYDDGTAIRSLAQDAGIDVTLVDFDQAPKQAMRDLLAVAARAGALRELLRVPLRDRGRSSIHADVASLLGEPKAS